MASESDNQQTLAQGSAGAEGFVGTFPHLSRAPIVEAVLELRCRAGVAWDQEPFRVSLKGLLPDYPHVHAQRLIRHELRAGAGKPPERVIEDLGWRGLAFRTADERHVAQFKQDGFVFSRLHPYENWEGFTEEALRLWQIHLEVAQPTEIQRLGVRFINRLVVPLQGQGAGDYLTVAPASPPGFLLPFASFFHQELHPVPDTDYGVNLIKTVEPVVKASGHLCLILDIDAFTETPVQPSGEGLRRRLAQLRWLKNKAFFANVTAKALDLFR